MSVLEEARSELVNGNFSRAIDLLSHDEFRDDPQAHVLLASCYFDARRGAEVDYQKTWHYLDLPAREISHKTAIYLKAD